MVFCTYCGREFTRAEHLQRHILTHTKVRPFACNICHLSFSRKDAAQKHQLIHSKAAAQQSALSQSSSDNTAEAQSRLQAACADCATTKSKCDRQYPCSRCRLRSLSCTPRTSHRASSNVHLAAAPEGVPNRQGHVDVANPSLQLGHDNATTQNLSNTPLQERQRFLPPDLPRQAHGLSKKASGVASGMHSTSPQTQHANYLSAIRGDDGRLPGGTDMTDVHYEVLLTSPPDVLSSSQDTVQAGHQGQVADSSSGLDDSTHAHGLPTSQPVAELPDVFEDASHIFSQFDWGWEKLFASQAATPNNPVLHPTALEDISPARSLQTQSVATPTRSVENVARLGDNFADAAPWSTTLDSWRSQHFAVEERFENVMLTETTRERMLAMAQTFFRLALDSLNVSSNPGTRFLIHDMKKYSSSSILLLPPSKVLHVYLEAFLTSFEPFYPVIGKKTLDPNTVVFDKHEQLAVVLLLLMIAYGAMRDSALKARRLSMGLLEICRLTMLHLLDKDSTNPRSAIVAHAALLSTYQSAFSGDKWLMDSSIGQMHQYLILSKHSRIFERDLRTPVPNLETTTEDFWLPWLEHEYASRLAYSWVMVDLEISLFYDSNPMLMIPELEKSLPASDELWLSPDASSWIHSWQKAQGLGVEPTATHTLAQQSLSELFQMLLENKLDRLEGRLQIMHLRLLLHPTHILIAQLCELTICVSPKPVARFPRTARQTSSSLRFEEINILLRAWWVSFNKIKARTTRERAQRQLTEILFHLLNLRMTVSFPHLEEYSRGYLTQPENMQNLLDTGVRSRGETIFHCGQVLRVICGMEYELRPLWWPSAIYRAGIILWALGVSQPISNPQPSKEGTPEEDFVIDTLLPDDRAWQPFLKYNRGRPCLTASDGASCPLSDAGMTLRICSEVLRQGSGLSHLTESLLVKLEALCEA